MFSDDFNENVSLGQFPTEVASKWGAYPDGWPDTTHHGTYEPTQVVRIHDGIMNLFLHTANGVHMVAAPYPKIPGATGADGGVLYGMYEVRFRAQQVKGYKTAWLLWPDSENQQDGEIDFPEGNLQQNIIAFMHHRDSDPKLQDSYQTSYSYADWHTATTIWTANAVIFMLDGKVIGESTNKSNIPDKPMHWVLQTETRTGGGPPSDTATANVQIDWVSVWLPQNS
jgi:beta-glucanase (GH16 family)